MWTCQQCGYVTTDDENTFCGRCGSARDGSSSAVYTLFLTGFLPERKISVIKAVRMMSHLGLKDAKDLVEHAPQPVVTNLSRDMADRLLSDLCAAGGGGEIQPANAVPDRLRNPVSITPQQPKSTTGCAGILFVIGALISLAMLLCCR